MNFFKTSWSKIVLFLQYLGIVGKAKTLVNTFPGIDDQAALRVWVINNADSFLPVVSKTANKIDDRIVLEVRRIALNEKAFGAIYHLSLLAYEVIPKDAKTPTEAVYSDNTHDCAKAFAQALEGEDVGNPMVFIAVAGLILQVIMFVRSRKATGG